MKKSFTLIELLISLLLTIIFFQFLLHFKLNFISELQNLKKENELVKDSYRLSQMLTKGFSNNNRYYQPLISIDNLYSGAAFDFGFESYNEEFSVLVTLPIHSLYEINNNELRFTRFLSLFNNRSFTYDKHNFFNTINLASAEDETNIEGIYRLRYSIQDKTNQDIQFENYIKLVYAR
jgi:hypothetical protein